MPALIIQVIVVLLVCGFLFWAVRLVLEQNHAKAAKALADKLQWAGKYHMGGLPDDRGYVFVCAAFDDATLAFGE